MQMDFFLFFFFNLIAFKLVLVIFWVQILSDGQAWGAEPARQPRGAPPLPQGWCGHCACMAFQGLCSLPAPDRVPL